MEKNSIICELNHSFAKSSAEKVAMLPIIPLKKWQHDQKFRGKSGTISKFLARSKLAPRLAAFLYYPLNKIINSHFLYS